VRVPVAEPGPLAGHDAKAVKATWDALNDPAKSPDKPLLPRAYRESYHPGSTFKVVTTTAAIDSGRYTPGSTLNGDSPKTISGVALQNDYNQSFGTLDLNTALTNSVNTVGRLPGTVSSDRNGGNRPSPIWNPNRRSRCGPPRPRGPLLLAPDLLWRRDSA